jgi:hypothetical protein
MSSGDAKSCRLGLDPAYSTTTPGRSAEAARREDGMNRPTGTSESIDPELIGMKRE